MAEAASATSWRRGTLLCVGCHPLDDHDGNTNRADRLDCVDLSDGLGMAWGGLVVPALQAPTLAQLALPSTKQLWIRWV